MKTSLEERLLEKLKQSEKHNEILLTELSNLFRDQNNIIMENTTEINKLSLKIESQQQQIENLTNLLDLLIDILKKELEN